MLGKSHVSMLAIHLPSSEPGRALCKAGGRGTRFLGRRSCSPAVAGLLPAPLEQLQALTQGSSTAQGLGVSSGELALESVCFLHLCEVRDPGPLAVTPSSASAQRDPSNRGWEQAAY